MKNNSVKFQIFDTVTNGGKYFYHSQRPGCDLQWGFSRANSKKVISSIPGSPNFKIKKEFMSFVDFYRHQYAFSPSVGTSLLCWNKLTTPKETILKRKNHVSYLPSPSIEERQRRAVKIWFPNHPPLTKPSWAALFWTFRSLSWDIHNPEGRIQNNWVHQAVPLPSLGWSQWRSWVE